MFLWYRQWSTVLSVQGGVTDFLVTPQKSAGRTELWSPFCGSSVLRCHRRASEPSVPRIAAALSGSRLSQSRGRACAAWLWGEKGDYIAVWCFLKTKPLLALIGKQQHLLCPSSLECQETRPAALYLKPWRGGPKPPGCRGWCPQPWPRGQSGPGRQCDTGMWPIVRLQTGSQCSRWLCREWKGFVVSWKLTFCTFLSLCSRCCRKSLHPPHQSSPCREVFESLWPWHVQGSFQSCCVQLWGRLLSRVRFCLVTPLHLPLTTGYIFSPSFYQTFCILPFAASWKALVFAVSSAVCHSSVLLYPVLPFSAAFLKKGELYSEMLLIITKLSLFLKSCRDWLLRVWSWSCREGLFRSSAQAVDGSSLCLGGQNCCVRFLRCLLRNSLCTAPGTLGRGRSREVKYQ